MSQLEVDKIIPQSGTTLTIGDSGDTVNFADGTNLSIDTNTLYIDSTNNRVGIANASPSVALDVTGAAKVSGNLTVGDGHTIGNDGTFDNLLIQSSTGENIEYNSGLGSHIFKQNGTEVFRIKDSTGNVGIGTSSPSRPLHIVSSDNQLARFESTDTYGGIELCDNTSGTAKPLISAVANDFIFYRGGSSHTVAFGATSVGFGVGTASPDRELTVGGVSNARIGILSNDNSTGASQLQFGDPDNSQIGRIYYEHSDNSMRLHTNNTEQMRITSSGDVFIGDSNPAYSSRLTVSGNGSADTGLFMYDGSAGTYLNITTNDANGVVDLEANARTGSYPPLTFSVSTAERMRISGNTVMIGKTSNGIANDGVELKTNDVSRFTQTSRNVIEINRKTDDGDIVQFKKDGTTVGSIASNSGSIELDSQGSSLKFSHLGTNLAFLLNTNFAPNADNAMDLGASSERFKDLYLGGGVYLGGTGSANKLDDYEEGTWTPIVNSANGFSTGATNYTGTAAPRYTKIGNRVFLQAQVQMANSSGNVALDDNITMTGLPFTPADIERNTVTEYRYNSNVAYMTSYLTGAGAIFSAVRFLKGTPQRGGGSLNININYTV